MARYDPQEIAREWAERTKASKAKYIRNVNSVQEAPGVSAARHEDAMIAHTMEALESGRWRENVSAVPKEEWQRKTAGKGATNLVTGVEASREDVARGVANLAADWERIRQTARAMPKATPEQAEARRKYAEDQMRALKGKFGRNRR